jgi:hypothetical protein
MNADTFAAWLRRQGHRVIRTPNSYWYDAGPRVYQAFPYHWLIAPPDGELRWLLLRRGIAALRYSTPLAAPQGMISYHVLLRGPYTLEQLRAQARNGVRRGLGRFNVERIPFERLAEEGWGLQADTLERQGRSRSMRQAEWQRLCRAAIGLPGFEAWGALCDGELAGALVAARVDDTYCVPYALSHARFLRDHVNNALFFATSCNLLSCAGVTQIFFTLQSLDAPESVDEFKFRMGLGAVPVRQRVAFHPALRPLAGAHSLGLVRSLLARHPGDPLLAKAEGMLHFYNRGRLPLADQEWPACLADDRGQPAAPVQGTRGAAPRVKGRVPHETA